MTITKKLAALLSGVVLSAGIFRVVQASPADYAAYFKVDLNEPLPKYADLERKYLVETPVITGVTIITGISATCLTACSG